MPAIRSWERKRKRVEAKRRERVVDPRPDPAGTELAAPLPAANEPPWLRDDIDAMINKAVHEATAANQLLIGQTPSISEDEYVAMSLMRKGIGKDDPQRKDRAERYARWRYRGFCRGVVATL